MAREELTPSKRMYLLVRPNGNEPSRKDRLTRVFKFLREDCATQMERPGRKTRLPRVSRSYNYLKTPITHLGTFTRMWLSVGEVYTARKIQQKL